MIKMEPSTALRTASASSCGLWLAGALRLAIPQSQYDLFITLSDAIDEEFLLFLLRLLSPDFHRVHLFVENNAKDQDFAWTLIRYKIEESESLDDQA